MHRANHGIQPKSVWHIIADRKTNLNCKSLEMHRLWFISSTQFFVHLSHPNVRKCLDKLIDVEDCVRFWYSKECIELLEKIYILKNKVI